MRIQFGLINGPEDIERVLAELLGGQETPKPCPAAAAVFRFIWMEAMERFMELGQKAAMEDAPDTILTMYASAIAITQVEMDRLSKITNGFEGIPEIDFPFLHNLLTAYGPEYQCELATEVFTHNGFDVAAVQAAVKSAVDSLPMERQN